MNPMTRRWHLRTLLIWLLCTSSLVTFVVIGAVLFFVRVPQITAETRAELSADATDLAHRSEVILGALEAQLDMLAALMAATPGVDVQAALDQAVAEGGAFVAIYQVGADDAIARAGVAHSAGLGRREELVGNDLSRDPLLLRVRSRREAAWSDKYISPVSGAITVGIGVPAGRGVLVGEVPLAYLLKTLRAASGSGAQGVSILDRRGEVLADSDRPGRGGTVNLAGEALFLRARETRDPIGTVVLDGRRFDAALAHSHGLDWYFLVRSPSGIANPRIGPAVDLGVAALVGSLLLGVLLAPFWATSVARPINAITERARRVADGEAPGEWPRLRTFELNNLSADLERMHQVLRAREQELQAIFDASPVGIGVLDPQRDYAFIKVNEAVCQLLGLPASRLLGYTGVDIALWDDPAERAEFYTRLSSQGIAQTEALLRRGDGNRFLAAIITRNVSIAGLARTVWVVRDVTALRRIESEIRQLNTELEARVEKRTEQLHQANTELAATVERLPLTLGELVRAEKLASLGSLVAGIAHELNTPLGNGVMAVSSVRGALSTFRTQSAGGLRRSMLDQLLEAVDTGTDIAGRNLARAAELVTSFKQVAADQTSSQRRGFDLDELTSEIVLTLRPLLKKSGATIEVSLPPGIHLESYPGPLGQVLTNLVSNAVTHAFEGRSDGHIRIGVDPAADDRVVIRVDDDGSGIAPALLPRVFDPFVTTRMGRGGTGLGLHIAHNLVVQVLGGSIAVHSEPGVGTRFVLDLPRVAPLAVAGAGTAPPTVG